MIFFGGRKDFLEKNSLKIVKQTNSLKIQIIALIYQQFVWVLVR